MTQVPSSSVRGEVTGSLSRRRIPLRRLRCFSVPVMLAGIARADLCAIFITPMSFIKNEFAPVTFRFGFVEASFAALCDAFEQWHKEIDIKFAVKTEFRNITAPLETALLSLQPLTTSLNGYLLVETKSNWTAIFANGLRVNYVFSPVSHLPLRLNCRGLEVGYAPDRSKSERKDLIRVWGHALFALYGPSNTDWLNRIRYLSVSNDVSGWNFSKAATSNHMKK